MTPYTAEDLAQARALLGHMARMQPELAGALASICETFATALHNAHQAGVAEGRTLGIEAAAVLIGRMVQGRNGLEATRSKVITNALATTAAAVRALNATP